MLLPLFWDFVFFLQKNYKQHIERVKYKSVTDTPEILLAKKNAQLVSNVSKHYDSARAFSSSLVLE